MLESRVLDNTIHFSTTRIAEWERKSAGQFYQSGRQGLWPSSDLGSYTAVTHVSFDMSIDDSEADDILVRPFGICQQLGKCPTFETNQFVMLYVREISRTQITRAKKQAYDEAAAEAKSLAALSGRPLASLAELACQVEGSWRGWSKRTYANAYDDTKDNPLLHFSPAENEVFGTAPPQSVADALHRTSVWH